MSLESLMKNPAEPNAPRAAEKSVAGLWTTRLLLLLVAFALGGCATSLCPVQGRIGEKRYCRAPALKKNQGAIAVFLQDRHAPPTEWRLITETGPERDWLPVEETYRPGCEIEKNAQPYGIEFKLCHPTIGVCAPEVRTITLLEEQILEVPIVYGPAGVRAGRSR